MGVVVSAEHIEQVALMRLGITAQQLLDCLPHQVFIKDTASRFIYVNQRLATTLGVDAEQMLGRTDFDFFPAELASHYQADDQKLFSSGQPVIIEEPYRPGHSETRWIRTYKVPLYDQHQRLCGLLGLFEDISQLHHALHDLNDRENYFQAIWRSTADALLITSLDSGHVLDANPQALKLFQCDLQQLQQWQYPQSGVHTATLDETHFMAFNRQFSLECNSSLPLRLGDQWVVLRSLRDVHEREQMRRDLLRQTQRLKEAQQLAHLSSWEFDLTTQQFIWSPEALQLCEANASEFGVNEGPFTERIHPEDRERVCLAYDMLKEHGQAYAITFRLLLPSGRIKYVFEHTRVEYDEHGRPLYLLGTLQDISQLHQQEQRLQRLNWTLTALSRSNNALVRAQNEQQLMQGVCAALTGDDLYPLAWVGWAQNNAQQSVQVVTAAGLAKTYLDHLDMAWDDSPLGQGPVGRTIRSGQAQIINDIHADPCFIPWIERAQQFGMAAVVVLPLYRHVDHSRGVLVVYAREVDAFAEQELQLFSELAANLSYGIDAWRTLSAYRTALDERERQASQLQRVLEKTIEAIASTLEHRDPYTAGHQRRVAHLATAIAQEMGLDEQRIRGLHLAATVHDLGKVQVPAEILTKPSRLTALEYQLMQLHPTTGYEILKDIDFPWPIAEVVYQHHEYLDGSGYPRALRDEQILLESRILTVADIVESMSTHRPYRAGLGIEVALQEITRLSGSKLDTQVVSTCVRLFHEQGYTFNDPWHEPEPPRPPGCF